MIVQAGAKELEFLMDAVVTIGSFDGVHCGHQALLQELVRQANRVGGVATVVTFSEHPRMVLGKGDVALLTTPTERNQLLAEYGAEWVVELPFTPEVARLTAEEFIREFIVGQLHAKALLLGYDHRFGSDRHTTPSDHIERLCEEYGIECVRYEPLMVEGQEVSSSEIRELLRRGHTDYVVRLLGRPYTMECQAKRGFLTPLQRGKMVPGAANYQVLWCRNDEPEELYAGEENQPVVELVEDVLVVMPDGQMMLESDTSAERIMIFFEQKLI